MGGLNYKNRLTIEPANGHCELKIAGIGIYHVLGQLSEPELTYSFC